MTNQTSPLTIDDITIVDQSKLKKAVTAAALGNTMEWFDFGVYGFVAFALGKVFFLKSLLQFKPLQRSRLSRCLFLYVHSVDCFSASWVIALADKKYCRSL